VYSTNRLQKKWSRYRREGIRKNPGRGKWKIDRKSILLRTPSFSTEVGTGIVRNDVHSRNIVQFLGGKLKF
jgi:hypothetical protein